MSPQEPEETDSLVGLQHPAGEGNARIHIDVGSEEPQGVPNGEDERFCVGRDLVGGDQHPRVQGRFEPIALGRVGELQDSERRGCLPDVISQPCPRAAALATSRPEATAESVQRERSRAFAAEGVDHIRRIADHLGHVLGDAGRQRSDNPTCPVRSIECADGTNGGVAGVPLPLGPHIPDPAGHFSGGRKPQREASWARDSKPGFRRD